MPLCQTIRQLREELGLSQDELAKRLGYKTRSTIAKIESGSNDIPQSKIAAFAAALETTPARLLGLETSPQPPARHETSAYTKRVPLLGTIAAGCPLFAEENIEEYIEINDSIKADFCLRVRGDSMTGARIYDGDLVFIRRQSDVEDGENAQTRLQRHGRNSSSLRESEISPDGIHGRQLRLCSHPWQSRRVPRHHLLNDTLSSPHTKRTYQTVRPFSVLICRPDGSHHARIVFCDMFDEDIEHRIDRIGAKCFCCRDQAYVEIDIAVFGKIVFERLVRAVACIAKLLESLRIAVYTDVRRDPHADHRVDAIVQDDGCRQALSAGFYPRPKDGRMERIIDRLRTEASDLMFV